MTGDTMLGFRAIVTGGGTGLGAATAVALAKRGAKICVNYSRSADAAHEVVDACCKEGVEAIAVQGDVAQDGDCRRLVSRAVTAFGGLDILINNAGVTKFASLADLDALDADDFLRLFRVNVVSAFQMVRAARDHIGTDRIGTVVNVSSIAAVTGVGSSIAYASTKGALNTLTLSLARVMAPRCRVNAICPGYISSGWFTKNNSEAAELEAAERVRATTPLRVASAPEDIAEAVIFLAGPESRHITGETLLVDAGMHLGLAAHR